MSGAGRAPEVSVTGTIERFTFRNPDSGWAVARIRREGSDELVTAVGPLAQLNEGQCITFSGAASTHPRFGPQIEVSQFEAVAPSTIAGLEAYLASGLAKGIGPATAKRVVEQFGAEALRVIEHEPQRLHEVRGIGRRKGEELHRAVVSQKELQNVHVFLRSHGLGAGLAARIVRSYGKNASALIQANPYRLADEVVGIGFRLADRLAGSIGIAPEAPDRIDAGLEFCLAQAAKEGHCFLAEDELVQRTSELITLAAPAVAARVPELAAAGRIVRQLPPGPRILHEDPQPIVYPRMLALAEDAVARGLDRLLRRSTRRLPIQVARAVAWFESTSGMVLPAGQREALERALAEPVCVITGGPGVGKTTIVRALARILAEKKLRLVLAAPTGRAAKRLEESTGHATSTVHRLLEFVPGLGRFQRDESCPLEGEMLVVDESSMLDVQLAQALIAAVPPTMKLVLIGDRNQLPSVGPGNVLADIIASGRVSTTALTEIFRQQAGSDIVRVAHGILRGEVPTSGGETGDFFFVEAKNPAHARNLIRELIAQRIPRKFGLHPLNDVQVLCPMYRGETGADALNLDLQDLLNPGQIEVERSGKRFRVGDKVMQVRNDYDREVWNGDVGRISYIDAGAAKVHVDYPDGPQQYRLEDLGDLVPAYAVSVHRSQGSEYPAVVLPMTTDHFLMLRRSVLYTAITRGKRLVVIVGSKKALEMAVRNNDDGRRNSSLAERLRDLSAGGGGDSEDPTAMAAEE